VTHYLEFGDEVVNDASREAPLPRHETVDIAHISRLREAQV